MKGTMQQHGKGSDRGNKGKGGSKTGMGRTVKGNAGSSGLPKCPGRSDTYRGGGKKK
jgi:hypothetical protein